MKVADGRFGFLLNELKSIVIKADTLSFCRIKFLFVFLTLLTACQSCNYAQTKDQGKAHELITIRTLGLAYLEEFKLEEAEKEFLKFIRLAPKEKLGYANLGLTYLRMGKYPEAEKQLLKAVKIDPKDPDIRLILATVYQMNDSPEKAIAELKEALKYTPGHLKTLYDISEIYSTGTDNDSKEQREFYTRKLVDYAPANIVPRLNLIDILIRKGDMDKALEQMEILKKQYPEFPKEAADYYNRTIISLRNPGKENPLNSFMIFHNYLKVTSPYQAGIMDLKGPGGSLVGFPLITFDQEIFSQSVDSKMVLGAIRFTAASASAGLDIVKPDKAGDDAAGYITNNITCDYDGDGDIDIYASWLDPVTSSSKHYLLNNEMGRFKEVSSKSGIRHSGKEYSASFADYDNDGFPDLYIIRDGGNILYRNTGKGTFEDVTAKAGVADKTADKAVGNMSLFADLDHDGDLDLFLGKTASDKVYRNNSDGTFSEQTARMGFSTGAANTVDAAFGDFDDDGDIDLFAVNEKSGNSLYSNQRQGIFRDIAAQSGLKSTGGSGAVAAGDYDNDGFIDLFVTSLRGGNHMLYTNLRNGNFRKEEKSKEIFKSLQNVIAYDASFLDFDNDGFLDLFIAGESAEKGGKGLFLFHNDGKGSFANTSNLLPSNINSGRKISVMDYNDDGDLDIIVAGSGGTVTLLRNDGGNAGHFINMKLVGLRAGSAKNNYFGIGAKVELRSGDLYQTTVVIDPNIHFGIGSRARADVIRITWTNGVPQNIFFPGTDQSIIENQVLKGSCPFLYTWNGNDFVFVKDIMWRSGLGMPLGIMGGTTAYAFADASDDYLKIPGDLLKPKGGLYSLQVTAELWETIYFDKVQLVAVDHPDSTDIFVDEKFSGPPFPSLKIYSVGEKHLPVSATDGSGNDVLTYITEKDDKYLSDFQSDKYQGITEMRDLILDPGKVGDDKRFYLFLQGWIFPTDASINVALSQSPELKVTPPSVQVIDENGNWITVIENLGFPMGKDKTVIADLSGKFLSGDHRIRIRTNMEIYWDKIFWSDCAGNTPVITNTLDPVRADIHYRGFSGKYRKGGRYGPHWFDYSTVDPTRNWRDLTGNYTRYGDVLPLLTEADDKYIITNAGDETSVDFSPEGLPELKRGWKRDFLIRSVGWVKDGDLNTAYGNSVLPLPFHGMKSYPPDENDKYPDDADHQEYIREYNTRIITSDGYRKTFREKELNLTGEKK